MKISQKCAQCSFMESGFTLIELIVVIVVIGILAAVTIVAYTGITQKAIITSLQFDLTNASQNLILYQADHKAYPATLNGSYCPTDPTDADYCFKPSSPNTYSYWADNNTNHQSFRLTSSNNGNNFSTDENNIRCPLNFIIVPGSSTYNTNDFCLMKYEAKDAGGIPVSTVSGSPWVNISQTTAITKSSTVAGCTGCHLMTEAEWLTVAQNVLSVGDNWRYGTVGSGYFYSGHNDVTPNSALVASINDADGFNGTGQSFPSNQKRTYKLTNGEVIWDLAGNVWEWTSGTSTTGQPGISGEIGYSWKEWTALTAVGTLLPNVFPSGTGISGSNTWNSSIWIGRVYSYASETGLRGFIRGGDYESGGIGGVFALGLDFEPSGTSSRVGFRVSR